MSRFKYNIFIVIIILFGIGSGFYIYKTHYSHEEVEKNTTVTLWYAEDDSLNACIPDIVDEFNAINDKDIRHNITVDVRSFENYAALKEALSFTRRSSGPDMIVCDANNAAVLKDGGYAAELSEYFDEWNSAEFNSDLVKCISVNGKLAAVPYAADLELMIVNEDFVSDADDISSLEDLCSTAENYYKNNSKPMFSVGDYAKFFRTTMAQFGEEFNAVSPRNTTNDNCKYIYKLLAQSAFDRGMISSDDPVKTVISGDVPCAIVSSSEIMAHASDMGKKIKIYACPCVEDGKQVYNLDVRGICICKTNSNRQNAAAEFIKWFISSDVNGEFVADNGYIPVRGTIDDLKSDKAIFAKLTKVISSLDRNAKHTDFAPNIEYVKNYDEFIDVMELVMDSLS